MNRGGGLHKSALLTAFKARAAHLLAPSQVAGPYVTALAPQKGALHGVKSEMVSTLASPKSSHQTSMLNHKHLGNVPSTV